MFDNRKAGKQIALLRKSKGLTQEEVAERLNISPQAVSKWENGRAMPELSVLVELSELLDSTIDGILFPASRPAVNANFEYTLLPYAPIAGFTGKSWPRSMAKPAILSAVKLFMGLEKHMDSMSRQINDDTEYVLQSAFSSICFGYSWEPEKVLEDCLMVYGLTAEVHRRTDCSEEEFIRLAVDTISGGYPVLVIPDEYTDMILATGFSNQGKILRGLPFLDGDDGKNSVMSFGQLKNFPEWYVRNSDMLLIKPYPKEVSITAKCREALEKGVSLLSNKVHRFQQPLVGYGLVIYDNWCDELRKENNQKLQTIECMFPHIFIHYEGKLRIRQFLELCMQLLEGMDNGPFMMAISKYEEMIAMCEKCIHGLFPQPSGDAEKSSAQRQILIELLQRSKELEAEALEALAPVVQNVASSIF